MKGQLLPSAMSQLDLKQERQDEICFQSFSKSLQRKNKNGMVARETTKNIKSI